VFGALYYQENVQDDARAFNTARFTNAAGQAFYKSLSTTSGLSGIFNDPRTFGVELGLKL
jgi:hypothetical protein